MRQSIVIGLAIAAASGAAAQACELHEAEYSPMSAYFSYRTMSEEERRVADAAARAAAREQDIMQARNALMSRFSIKVERGPDEPQLAQAEQPARPR